MSISKPAKTKESSGVKFSNKTGGAYVDMKKVIESERQRWKNTASPDRNGDKDLKQGSKK